jgi:hypothetical protein
MSYEVKSLVCLRSTSKQGRILGILGILGLESNKASQYPKSQLTKVSSCLRNRPLGPILKTLRDMTVNEAYLATTNNCTVFEEPQHSENDDSQHIG